MTATDVVLLVPAGADPATALDHPDLADLAARERPAWHQQAACRDHEPAVFVSDDRRRTWAGALAVCGRCPVLIECRSFAVNHDEHLVGCWGGMTPKALTAARRARRRSQR